MYIENIDINIERQRILNHVLALLDGDDCYYDKPKRDSLTARVEIPSSQLIFLNNINVATTIVNTEVVQPFAEVDVLTEVANSSTVTPSPLCRMVLRKRASTVLLQNISNVIKETKSCKRLHKNVGCAADSAKHMPNYYDSGKFGDKICLYCGALLLQSESSAKCCSQGKVNLPAWQSIPEPFLSYKDRDRKKTGSAKFQKFAKEYNNLLFFASLQVGRVNSPGREPSVCLLNGDFRHLIGDLIPPDGQIPKFLSLYFLDTERALQARLANANSLNSAHQVNENILNMLDAMLRRTHPMAKSCMLMKDMYETALQESEGQPIPYVRLTLLNEKDVPNELRDTTLHSRQVNGPAGDTICALWVSRTEQPIERKGIYITEKSGRLQTIGLYDKWVDMCTYSLLFPNGESGYTNKIVLVNVERSVNNTFNNLNNVPANESNFDIADEGQITEEHVSQRFVSCRQFYMYRLQLRGLITNVHHVFNLGRLTQTYIIDASFKVDQQDCTTR